MNQATRLPSDERFEYFASRVCAVFDVTRDEVLGPSREVRYAWPRQVLCHALREIGWELKRIGEHLGRDHATVHYACNKVMRRIRVDRDAAYMVREVMDGYLTNLDMTDEERALVELRAASERIHQAIAAAVAAAAEGAAALERIEARARALRDTTVVPVVTRGAA